MKYLVVLLLLFFVLIPEVLGVNCIEYSRHKAKQYEKRGIPARVGYGQREGKNHASSGQGSRQRSCQVFRCSKAHGVKGYQPAEPNQQAKEISQSDALQSARDLYRDHKP